MTSDTTTPLSIRNERGQAMTEFALVLPVLALMLFAVIQFGIAFNNYITVTDAVRAGARKAAVSRGTADPARTVEAAVRASAAGLDPNQARRRGRLRASRAEPTSRSRRRTPTRSACSASS